MIKSLALESGLGLWKLGIGLSLLLVLAPGLGYGQDSSKSSGGIPKKVAPAAKKVAQPVAKKGTEVNSEESQGPETPAGHYEIFKDDRAEEALGKLKSVGKDCPPKIVSDIRSMAAGQIPVDSETIQKFVSGMANRLTDKSNINAVVSPPANLLPTSPAARAVAVTVDNLIDPLLSAKALKNTSFLNAYNQELLATLPQLLNNHLVSRIQAAIVLAQTGSAQNLPIFLAQLKDPKQTIWVKLWATRGITNIVDGGRSADSALSATDASNAAKAVVDYLKAEKELPWPAQLRALETLGALRQPGLPSSPQKAEIAATAMQFLADPDARLEVRVEAAWAMGMFQVSSAIAKYNFSLIGYHNGLIAAEIGEKINASFPGNTPLAEYLAGLLVSQLYQSFNGIENVRESGLLKLPAGASSQPYLKQVSDLQSSMAKTAVELIRNPPGLQKGLKKDLGDRIAALKAFLAKNPPKDFRLIPDGPEYRVTSEAAVADASAAERPKVSAGGR